MHEARGDVDHLVELVCSRVQDKTAPILYVRGRNAAKPLADILGERGVLIDEYQSYEAVPARYLSPNFIRHIEQKTPMIVTLFSLRTAEAFLRLMAEAIKENADINNTKAIKLLCISPAVVKYVQQWEWAGVYVSAAPTQEAMTDVLEKL